jgi:hypothetical protein
MILYDKPGFLQISHRADGGYILFDWTSFMITLDDIQQAHHKALTGAQQHDCWFYLADSSKVRNVLRQEVIDWWGKIWIPKLSSSKLRAILTVVPTSAIATLSTRSWQAEVSGGIVMKNAKNLVEAQQAIEQLRAAPAVPR